MPFLLAWLERSPWACRWLESLWRETHKAFDTPQRYR